MDRKHDDGANRATPEPGHQASRRRDSWSDAERARAERLRRRSRIGAWLGLLGAAVGALVAWIRGDDPLHAIVTGTLVGVIAGMAVGTFVAGVAQLQSGESAHREGHDRTRDHTSGDSE